MKTKLYFILLIGVFFCSCKNTDKVERNTNALNLTDLIRISYEFTDSPNFIKLCELMNDSIFSKNLPIEMDFLTSIDMEEQNIDWSLENVEEEMLISNDRLFYKVILSQNIPLHFENVPEMTSDIPSLGYHIYYPDSTEKNITHISRTLEKIGTIDVSVVVAIYEVNISEWKNFYVKEWKLFFKYLGQLIEVCEDHRNKISLNLFDKNFDSLPFEEQIIMTDIVGYNIKIRFN